MLDIDLKEAVREIKERNAKSVLLQIPEGLKLHITGIVDELSKTGAEIFVSMDPCYGACDLAIDKMKALNADLLIHLGHAPIHRPKNVVHIPIYDRVNEETYQKLLKEIKKELTKQKFKTIGLCTHSQFLYLLDRLKNDIEGMGFKVLIGNGSQRIAEKGQVLGCNYTVISSIEQSIDAVLYYGEGYFHPIGIVFTVKKPVLFADTSRQMIVDLTKERDKYQRKRFAAIARAKEAQRFGILISTKTGQRYKMVAEHCKKLIEQNGKKAFLFTMDLVREDYLAGVDVDCFVNTACTRIVGDDADYWKKPVINPIELEIAFGAKKWEEFVLDTLY